MKERWSPKQPPHSKRWEGCAKPTLNPALGTRFFPKTLMVVLFLIRPRTRKIILRIAKCVRGAPKSPFRKSSATNSRSRQYQTLHAQEVWDSCAQNKASEISKNALSEILGVLCAEQHVGNLDNCTFRNSGTPVRRTTRRKSRKMHFQKLWDSCAQNKTSEI